MRHNQPVTTTEYRIQPGQSIVSKTDTKGRITYVNPTFVEVSGFSEVELLGKAHNLVRHPAMPPEAFADMWRTLQGGEPWTGLVKNRCKNGDFYWVVANVAPIRERGQITGYMSVRTAPTREQVETASALYRKFTDNEARGLAIVRGRVVRLRVVERQFRMRVFRLWDVGHGRYLEVVVGVRVVVVRGVTLPVVRGSSPPRPAAGFSLGVAVAARRRPISSPRSGRAGRSARRPRWAVPMGSRAR